MHGVYTVNIPINQPWHDWVALLLCQSSLSRDSYSNEFQSLTLNLREKRQMPHAEFLSYTEPLPWRRENVAISFQAYRRKGGTQNLHSGESWLTNTPARWSRSTSTATHRADWPAPSGDMMTTALRSGILLPQTHRPHGIMRKLSDEVHQRGPSHISDQSSSQLSRSLETRQVWATTTAKGGAGSPRRPDNQMSGGPLDGFQTEERQRGKLRKSEESADHRYWFTDCDACPALTWDIRPGDLVGRERRGRSVLSSQFSCNASTSKI